MRKFYLQLLWLLVSGVALSQTKIYSVIGSSTAAGREATVPDSAWVNRLTNHYQSLGLTIVPHNLAVGGRNCYHGMPSGYTPPPGRDFPQVSENITMALSFSPDVVIVSYVSNNYDFYSISEIMTCLQTMKDAANAQGKDCYVTTSQPRQDGAFADFTTRSRLKVIRDSIMNRFGNFAIDFYTGIADPITYTINTDYSHGDGVHLNDWGHRILFERVREKDIFNLLLPVRLADFSADPLTRNVYISWKVMDETPGIEYAIQRSKDGVHFENVYLVRSNSTKMVNNYKFIDKPVNTGVYFYRLMINENGTRLSSATKKVIINNELSIKRVVITASKIKLTLGSDEHDYVDIRIVSSLGATILQSRKSLNAGFTDLEFSVQSLPAGMYLIEVRGNTHRLVHEFLKK